MLVLFCVCLVDGFFCQISFADYAIFEILDCLVVLNGACLDAYPALKAYHARVAERPRLKAYLASDRRKGVPINGNGKQ